MVIKLLGSLFILNRWLLKYFPYAGSSPLYTIVQIIWKRVLLWPYFYLLRLEMEELTTSKSTVWELSRWVKAVSLWGCFHTCRSANLVRINGTKILVLVRFLFTLSVFLFVLMRQEERTRSYPDWQGTLWLDSFGIIRTDEGKIWLIDFFCSTWMFLMCVFTFSGVTMSSWGETTDYWKYYTADRPHVRSERTHPVA